MRRAAETRDIDFLLRPKGLDGNVSLPSNPKCLSRTSTYDPADLYLLEGAR